jgi:hypothetical protein
LNKIIDLKNASKEGKKNYFARGESQKNFLQEVKQNSPTL